VGSKSLTLAVARFVYYLRPFLPAHPNDFAIFQKLATTINEFFHMYMQISPGEPYIDELPAIISIWNRPRQLKLGGGFGFRWLKPKD